jgi:hypothetical protein
MKLVLFTLLSAGLAIAADPVHTAWIMSPAGSAALLPSLPEVHSVTAGEHSVIVRSAGIATILRPAPAKSCPAGRSA